MWISNYLLFQWEALPLFLKNVRTMQTSMKTQFGVSFVFQLRRWRPCIRSMPAVTISTGNQEKQFYVEHDASLSLAVAICLHSISLLFWQDTQFDRIPHPLLQFIVTIGPKWLLKGVEVTYLPWTWSLEYSPHCPLPLLPFPLLPHSGLM